MSMKRLNNLIYIAVLSMGLTACTNGFENVNSNPNKITVESETLACTSLFEPILYGGTNNLTYYSYYWNDELIQFTAFTGGGTREEHRYKIADSNFQSVWNMYASYAKNCSHMYD